jgi:xanthine permease XanP
MLGGAAPGPNSVVLGLSVTAGTLARRIVWVSLPMLVLLAFCPKLVVLFVLTPGPVRAAVLFFVAGFIVAQGCQLATARLLDTRRAMVVAFGLSAGLSAAVAPLAFLAALPALASPLAFGAVVAFALNLITMPLVTRRATRSLPLDADASRAVAEWAEDIARGWGLKPQTGRSFERSAVELTELLSARGVATVVLSARRDEDRVELALAWDGAPLPAPSTSPRAEDLLGETEERERFMVWMATREAQGFALRAATAGQEARLVFED